MFNQISRKQVEKVLKEFFALVPDSQICMITSEEYIVPTIASMGFKNRRMGTIKQMSKTFLDGTWTHARQLPGIGAYGSRAWEIFCQGILCTKYTTDGALAAYWKWAVRHEV